ncbi:MAG: hypothetical protein JXD18_00835, partial [Anaerolineae bacterium]|nr:hypothetical protein [Anaerolineae bacterium]
AAEPETITVQSLPAEDGIVRGVTSGVSVSLDGNIRAGDGTQNQRNEGFLSFDISGIPQGARIESAVLDLSGHSIEGTPFVQLGLLRVYFIEYASLGTEDYVAGNPTGSVTQSARPTQLLPTSAVQRSVDAGAARFQVRMQFEGISDNDGEIDGLIFPEGGPALTITYTP